MSKARSYSGSSLDSYLDDTEKLPPSTSRWNTTCLEKLGIYYDDEYHSSPLEVLDIAYTKTGCFGPMSDEQKTYVVALKEQLIIDFSINEIMFPVKEDDDASNNPVPSISIEMNRQWQQIGKYISSVGLSNQASPSVAEEFIRDLSKVIKYELASSTPAESRLEQGPVSKDLYVTLFNGFARICCVDVLPGSLWKAKKILCSSAVTSIADLLLLPLRYNQDPYLEGNSECSDNTSYDVNADLVAIVTVVQIKKGSLHREQGQQTLTEARLARHNSAVSNEKHNIYKDIDSYVLGQHGGELLMYTPFYDKKLHRNRKNRYCPGMLVIGTEVIFTLLETDSKHLSEVYTNENVEKRAKIYYSKPKDILKKEDRDELLETFIRLNNV